MTNEEILDRLKTLLDKYISGSSPTSDDAIEAAGLFVELSDRLTASTDSISFTISGSPEVLANAIKQMIVTTANPVDLEQLRADVVNAVLTKST